MRRLYQLILYAHPRGFRERFGAEMICVFDDAVQTEGGLRLVADGMRSLLRQRVLRIPLAGTIMQKPADDANVSGSFLVGHHPERLKNISRYFRCCHFLQSLHCWLRFNRGRAHAFDAASTNLCKRNQTVASS